ncbi:tubulin-like doman-containing protein [Clostridiaceae bacterium UIB06]|uniref:Tubulin-like doman-containing protein n=1 Tax=Clostridium thailandense TaxID=2794346 RepID=A0A949X2E1_9CLOT|nr:tubulin-like doman-containing protein [Clostridium thailandense]MBV7273139.1 tubulin-like doman-containing protein [Clostridium thailandense]MCH5137535.1 tubulin-like doman-containing protein [Clostridiaceae bacterium UIB06]
MNTRIREHLQDLDVSKGGGIISDKIRIETIENPVLIIGLGGTGIDAMLRLKYQINKRFFLDEDTISNTRKDKPKKVEFLGFETNQGEKNKRYPASGGVGLDPQSELVMLSNAEVRSILNDRKILDDCIKEWLAPELSSESGTDGAGGVRQIGRLLLFTKINEIVDCIEKKIRFLQEDTDQVLHVFILSGLSGGTGSGTFIDIAYIIRGIMHSIYGNKGEDKVNIMGYLFTPDVNLSRAADNQSSQSYIIKNGFAALKELDYLMGIGDRHERFRQKYRNRLTVDSPMPPFNLCHLISATNIDGRPMSNAYDYCMNVTAENIVNFMSNEVRESGGVFAIQDYISNLKQNTDNMAKPYMANYKYIMIGAASAVLPLEEITTYLAYKLFEKMQYMFDNIPAEQEVDGFIRQLKLDEDSVIERFEENLQSRKPLSGYKNREKYSYDNVIKRQAVDIDDEMKEYLRDCSNEYNKVKTQYPGEIQKNIIECVDLIFKDPKKGPFYASRMLFSSSFCVVKTLDSEIASLRERLANISKEIKYKREVAEDKLIEAKKAILFTKEGKKNDYIEAKSEEYMLKAEEDRIVRMMEFYSRIISDISDLNNKIYRVYTEILNELNKLFKEDGDILAKGEEIEGALGRTYSWTVVKVPDLTDYMEKIVNKETADELVRRFSNKLLEESQKWLDEVRIDVVGSISNFVSEEYGEVITQSMEEFLSLEYGEDKSIIGIIKDEIAPKLDKDAVPIFHISNTEAVNFPTWSMVSVPRNAKKILEGIKEYKKNSHKGDSINIKESMVTNRIFWLNTKNGVPLYSYAPIKHYEEIYEKTLLERDGIGRHLYQNGDKNWIYIPSPIPEESWGTTYDNERVKKYNDEVRKIFDRALELKCIVNTEKGSNENYKCIITEPFDVDEFMKKYSINLESDIPNISEIKKAIVDINKILDNGFIPIENSDMQRYYIFESSNEEKAKNNLIRTPELTKLVREEVEKYEELIGKRNELEKVIKDMSKAEMNIDNFLRALYTNTIVKKGLFYVYNGGEESKVSIEPFINALKQKEYQHEAIFRKYVALDERERVIVDKTSDKKLEQLSMEEGVETLILNVSTLLENIKDIVEELDTRKYQLINGDELFAFYSDMLLRVQEVKKQLE